MLSIEKTPGNTYEPSVNAGYGPARGGEAFADAMSETIKPHAGAAGPDRAAVYWRPGASVKMRQIYLWMQGHTIEGRLRELPAIAPVARWLEVLEKGGSVHNRVRDVTEDQAAFLRLLGTKTIFIAPVFARDKFKGVITLEKLNDDRYFDDRCLDWARAAARLCAGAADCLNMMALKNN